MSYPPPPQAPGNQAGAYLQRQLEQASPTQTLILLLEGALKFILQAKDAIARQDIAARHGANTRAIEILTFLLGQNDPALNNEAARRLSGIYTHLLQRCLRIDFENSPAICDEVAQSLRQLRAGFASLQPSTVVAGPSPALPLKLSASA